MKHSIPPQSPTHNPSRAAAGTTELSREYVLRLGRLSAAVVVAGALLMTGTAAADAATAQQPSSHARHATKTAATKAAQKTAKAKKHAKRRSAKKRHRGAKAWVATGAHATVSPAGSVSTVTDATGDVRASGSLLAALGGGAAANADADITRATVVRDGSTVNVTVDTARDYSGQQSLAVAGVLELSAAETFHVAVHAAGSATVYSATATVDGSGQLSADSAAQLGADGSVTFTVPVAALPRDAQLHVDLASDLDVSATALGGLVTTALSARLGDTLDFGFHTGD